MVEPYRSELWFVTDRIARDACTEVNARFSRDLSMDPLSSMYVATIWKAKGYWVLEVKYAGLNVSFERDRLKTKYDMGAQ